MQFSENVAKLSALRVTEQDGGLGLGAFLNYISVLWRRRSTIAATIIASLLVACVYLVLAPPRYTAATTIVLDTRHTPLVPSETRDEQQVDDAAVQSHVETIESANVAAIVIKKLNLTEDPEFTAPSLVERFLGAKPADKETDPYEATLRTAIERFKSGLRVTRTSLRTYVVEIGFTSPDPNKAAKIANATAEAYIEDQLQAKFEAADRGREWLQQRIAELRAQATDAFKAVQDFKSRTNLIVGGDGKLQTDTELQQLTESIAKARADTASAQSRLTQIETILSTQTNDDRLVDATVTDALNNAVITKLREQYLDDKKRATDWASHYGQNHQAVVSLRSDMDSLRREIREEMQRIAETYKSDLKVARSREEAIEKRLTEVFQNNRENRQLQVKLQDLETAANTYRSTYESFLNRYTQAVQQQSFPSTEARVITAALLGKKSSPKIIATLALAVAGGIALGAAAAFVREQMDRVIYAKDQLIRELGVDCIAVLPASGPLKETVKWTLVACIKSTFREIAPSQKSLAKQQKADPPRLLYNKEEPFSAISEALRNIKVSVDVRSISHETRTLAIVSALPNEGKSSVAASVAATIAEAGRKVLIMDCDFRNPTLTDFFGSQHRAGVMEILCGNANLADIVSHHGQYGFDFLRGPTKVRPVHTADLLTSEAMRKLLRDAKEAYDYVVVDLPPILPVIDVRASSHLFDTFALVVEWKKTSIDDLDRAFRAAPLVHERLLGVVLNKVDAEAMRRIEGYGYAEYGQYG
jgi:polysaccharide biosynthesis transport protein